MEGYLELLCVLTIRFRSILSLERKKTKRACCM